MAKDSVHRTIPPSQRRTSPPRRRRSTRRTSPPPTLARQQTLTQLDGGVSFLELPDSEEDAEWAEPRPRKRRRTQGTTVKRQATLTQIGYVSTIPPSDDEGMDEHMAESPSDEGNEEGASTTAESEASLSENDFHVRNDTSNEQSRTTEQRYTRRIALKDIPEEVAEINFEEPANKIPETPKRIRKLEIPSSQSPAISPLSSIHTQRSFDIRSPSQPLSRRRSSLLESPSRARKSDLWNDTLNRRGDNLQAKDMPKVSISTSEVNGNFQRKKSFIQDSLDGSVYDSSETEDEDEDLSGRRGIDIGQETQAVINRIDLACAGQSSARQPSDIGSDNEDFDDASPYRSLEQDLGIQQESQLRSCPPFIASPARERISKSPPTLPARIQDSFAQEITQESTPRATGGNQGHRSNQQRPQKVATPVRQSRATTRQQTAAQTASRDNNAHGWSHFPHPSQATTTASTTQDGSPARSPIRQQLSSSPFPMAPPTSSPVAIQQPRWHPKHPHASVDRVVTASQLLPDSLIDLSIPPPPRWTQDDEEDR